jgi:hypothetical protein
MKRMHLYPWGLVVGLLAVVGIAVWKSVKKEGFSYAANPCGLHKNCGTCTAAAGCGWCADKGLCGPMAQDGFPYRMTIDGRQIPVCAPFQFRTRSEQC